MKRGARIAIATAAGVLPVAVVALVIFAPKAGMVVFLGLLGTVGLALGRAFYRALEDD